uniref:Uncharacterized protein n=1 Tax=Oryza brachyantha TaxID=4533 RepID=J3MMW1_ORYBR
MKPIPGSGGQSTGGSAGGSHSTGALKPSRSSRVGEFILEAAGRVAFDAATDRLASAGLGPLALDSAGGIDSASSLEG